MPCITPPPVPFPSSMPEDPLSYFTPTACAGRRTSAPEPALTGLDQMYTYFDANRDGLYR